MAEIRLAGGTAASCALECACGHTFMSNSGEWAPDPNDPDVYVLDAAELVRQITEHRCPGRETVADPRDLWNSISDAKHGRGN